MSFVSMLAAAGVWPALPLTGYFLFARPRRDAGRDPLPLLTAGALLVAVGLAVWSPLLLGAAVMGVYRADYLGVLGWMVSGVALVVCFRETRRRRAVASPTVPSSPPPNATANAEPRARQGKTKRRPSSRATEAAAHLERQSPKTAAARDIGWMWEWALAAGLVIAAILYFGFPTESIYGGRDEGVYANGAVYLAHHGTLAVPYPWPSDMHALFLENAVKFPGFYSTEPTMTVQFGHLFSVWLAQAFSTLGSHGLFRLNAVFALLALASFYGLCRTVLPTPYAVAATLFLALNPSQLWMARITLSEVPTELFTVSGLALLISALRSGDRWCAGWAGALFGTAAFMRFDSLLLVPLLLLAHGTLRMVDARATSPSAPSPWPMLYLTMLPLCALAFGYFAVFNAPYLAERNYVSKLIVGCVAGSLALAASTPAVARRLRPLLTAVPTLTVVGTAWFAVAVWAYWIRSAPSPAPKLIYRWPGYSLDLTREYSRDSLVNLGRYVSPPILWMAIGGWFSALWDTLRRDQHRDVLVILIVVIGFSFAHLLYPIPEDHIWTVRRFMPVVMPGLVLCAALGARWLIDKLPPTAAIASAVLVLLLAGAFTFRASQLFFTFAEDKGYFAQIERLAERLPRDELILARGYTEWITPLYVAFDRRVVPLNLDPGAKGRTALQGWVARQAAQHKSVYLLIEGGADLGGLPARQLSEATISRVFSEPTLNPLPTKIITRDRNVRLYEIPATP